MLCAGRLGSSCGYYVGNVYEVPLTEVVKRTKAFTLHMKGAMEYTLHHILHILCPSKLCFSRPEDGWTGGWLSACW